MKSFKKIATGVAAAMSLGVLTALPTSAAVISPSLTIDSATANITAGETATATVTLSFISETSADTATVLSAVYSQPTGAGKSATLSLVETNTSTVSFASDSLTANVNSTTNTTGYVSAKLKVTLANVSASGTYVVNIVTTRPNTGPTVTWTVNVKAPDLVPVPTYSKAILNKGETTTATADESVFAPKTVSTDAAAVIVLTQKNAANATASESVTATITGAGLLGHGSNATTISALGRSLIVPAGNYIGVFADGTAGVGTITIATSAGVVLGTEKVTFYGDVASIEATPVKSVIAVGANTTTLKAVAKDASGVTVGAGTLYAYSSDVATISDSATAVSIVDGVATFTITGVKTGSANLTVKSGTVSSNAVPVRVEGTASTVKVTFDKATYAPGEAATISVQVLDAAGLPMSGKTFANLFTSTGISSTYTFGTGSDAITSASVTTDTTTVKAYKVFMPMAAGVVTISATGGTSLPTAGQVAVSASATVVDKSAEALSLVQILSAQITAFITKINAQITTLTDLVMKIQKKVKA